VTQVSNATRTRRSVGGMCQSRKSKRRSIRAHLKCPRSVPRMVVEGANRGGPPQRQWIGQGSSENPSHGLAILVGKTVHIRILSLKRSRLSYGGGVKHGQPRSWQKFSRSAANTFTNWRRMAGCLHCASAGPSALIPMLRRLGSNPRLFNNSNREAKTLAEWQQQLRGDCVRR
jgi:hypothetical protein